MSVTTIRIVSMSVCFGLQQLPGKGRESTVELVVRLLLSSGTLPTQFMSGPVDLVDVVQLHGALIKQNVVVSHLQQAKKCL